MSAFTPGPWRVQQCFDRVRGDSYVVLANDDICKVAECWVDAPSTDDEARKATAADARLIAAAPDIYEQLTKADALLRLIEDFLLYDKKRPKRPEWFGDVQTTIAGTSDALAKVSE